MTSISSLSLSQAGPPGAESQSRVILETTDGYKVDWQALWTFHEARSKSRALSTAKRAWHASQARQVATRHGVGPDHPWTWSDHCLRAKPL